MDPYCRLPHLGYPVAQPIFAVPPSQRVEWGAISAPRKLVPKNRQGVVDLDISREFFILIDL